METEACLEVVGGDVDCHQLDSSRIERGFLACHEKPHTQAGDAEVCQKETCQGREDSNLQD